MTERFFKPNAKTAFFRAILKMLMPVGGNGVAPGSFAPLPPPSHRPWPEFKRTCAEDPMFLFPQGTASSLEPASGRFGNGAN